MSARVLLFGIDGASRKLLSRWIDDGSLPALRRLRDRGLEADIDTPAGYGDDAAWVAVATGRPLGAHGRFHYLQPMPGSYGFDMAARHYGTDAPFWSRLAGAGRRTATIDLPKNALVRDFDGLHVCDWSVQGPIHGGCRTWPEAEAEAIARRHPCVEIEDLVDHGDAAAIRRHVDKLVASVAARRALAADYLAREAWDLFTVVFMEAHRAGHDLFRHADPAHPRHDAALAAALGGNPLLTIYRAIDAALGDLAARAGDGALVVAFAPLGMDVVVRGPALIDSFLDRWHRAERGPARMALEAARARSARAWHAARWRLGVGVPFADHRLVEAARARSLAYAVPSTLYASGIRVNLRGRDPAGTVAAADYDAIRDRLAGDLSALRDEATGVPAVAEVIRAGDRFAGPNLDRLPDLVVIWRREGEIGDAHAPRLGAVRADVHDLPSGEHVPDGFVIAGGPGLATGTRAPALRPEDLAPTIAARLGVALDGIEGRPSPALVPSPLSA